jgi:hypothetical protein
MKRIGTDFQGWPINAMSLMDILKQIGFKETKDGLLISKNNPLLDAYPHLLMDDGMGYGVDPQYITEIDIESYEDNIKTIETVEDKESEYGYKDVVNTETIRVFNVFRDVPENKIENDE